MPMKLHKVKPGPNRRKERVVGYYDHLAYVCERYFGRRPSRTTLYKYLVRGYPVARGGPYVRMPVFDSLKRPMTTAEAVARFLSLVRKLERSSNGHE
jgi:hypothetical protein